MYNVIAYWLKYYRSECGLTQQDVADLLGLERSSYTYYETGKTTPDIETLVRLSKIFHIDFYDLLSGCNTETGKYVSDTELKDLQDSIDHDNDDRYIDAKYEAEILLRIRSLNEGQKEEIMAILDDITDGKFKAKRANKIRAVIPREVEIPPKELELLARADIRNLPDKEKRKHQKSDDILD